MLSNLVGFVEGFDEANQSCSQAENGSPRRLGKPYFEKGGLPGLVPITLATDGSRRYHDVAFESLLQALSRVNGKAGAMSWWKHAFAVEPDGPAEMTPEQAAVIDALCKRVVDRGMALPAILFLESSRPLGPLAAQSLLLLQPWFELAVDRNQLMLLTKFLDRRGSFDTLCRRIEELSAMRDLRQQGRPHSSAAASVKGD